MGPKIRLHKNALLTLLALAAAPGISLQSSPQTKKPSRSAQNVSREWIREAIDNEIKQQTEDHALWSYQELIRRDEQEELRDICQTSIGEINRLVGINEHRLSAEQQRKEDQRIEQLLARPAEIRTQQQKRAEDIEEGRRMLALFPRAFHYQARGIEGDLTEISFIPDPSFEPVTRQQEIFRHVEGTLWINTQQKRLARIEGHLFSDVKFFGGLLGSLDKGGSFYLRQEDVGSGHWEMFDLDLEIRGRALVFKTIAVQERRQLRHYRQVPPDLTLQQGVELLRHANLAHDVTQSATPTMTHMPLK